MRIYDIYGIRTPVGVAISIFAFAVGVISVFAIGPVLGWGMISSTLGCEVECTPEFRALTEVMLACPILLVVSAVAGFWTAFSRTSATTIALTFLPAIFVLRVFTVDRLYFFS